MPTVLGWSGHERQWRGTDDLFKGREDDVRTIYETADGVETRRLLDKYGVTYVLVGARERANYSQLETAKFDSLGVKVFESDEVIIYRVRDQVEGSSS